MLSSGRFAKDSVGDPVNADPPDVGPPFISELSSWRAIDGCAIFVGRDGVGISVCIIDSVGDSVNADPPFNPELCSLPVIDGCAVSVESDGVGISVPVGLVPSRSKVVVAEFVVVRLRVQGQSVTVMVSPPVAVYVTPLVLNFVDDGHTVVNDETIVVKGDIISVELEGMLSVTGHLAVGSPES